MWANILFLVLNSWQKTGSKAKVDPFFNPRHSAAFDPNRDRPRALFDQGSCSLILHTSFYFSMICVLGSAGQIAMKGSTAWSNSSDSLFQFLGVWQGTRVSSNVGAPCSFVPGLLSSADRRSHSILLKHEGRRSLSIRWDAFLLIDDIIIRKTLLIGADSSIKLFQVHKLSKHQGVKQLKIPSIVNLNQVSWNFFHPKLRRK